MIHVLLHLRVEDYNRFRNAFDETLEWRRDRGEKSFDLYRRETDSTDLTLLFTWDEIGVARDVFGSAEWERILADAGATARGGPRFLQLLDRGSA